MTALPSLPAAPAETGTPKRRALQDWLPTRRQVADAFAGRMTAAVGPDPTGVPFRRNVHTTMRQGMGLVLMVGALAALPALVVNWVAAARMGTVAPIVRLVQWTDGMSTQEPARAVVGEAVRSLAGLQPVAPAWVAAGLSALGMWVNGALGLLGWWIVYGLAVLLLAKTLGAGTTLPRFYAATSYAALPLLLLAFGPLPWVGALFIIAGWLGALVLYSAAVRTATELSWGRAIFSTLFPAAILLIAAAVYGGVAWRWYF